MIARVALVALASVAWPDAEAQVASWPRPRLVVVIAVDQLRPDYLVRFRPYFGPGGFRLLLDRGASFANARYQHATTKTCPGHAVMLTGSYGDVNGIVANDWFDPRTGQVEYCAADPATRLIGSPGPGRSPRNLKGATVGDLLRIATGGASRVVAVAGKDRAAIMLGGHLADAAYWMVDTLFVTSSYYRDDLPEWVRRFNASGAITSAFGKRWERVLPAEAYTMVGADDVEGEADEVGMGRVFPHPIAGGTTIGPAFVEAFGQSPFGNDAVADFAMQAVAREGLGRDSVTDLLGIGFSANDPVGHAYGPESHEVMDITVRLDRTLARLFAFLDRTIGLANVAMVLTADHGVAPIPETLQRLRPGTNARRIHPDTIVRAVERALSASYGPDRWVIHHDAPHLTLDPGVLRKKKVAVEAAERTAAAAIAVVPGVHEALTATDLARQRLEQLPSGSVHSFYPGRSGNVYYQLEPYLLVDPGTTGTDHGTRWAYDQQVPLLWFAAAVAPRVHHGPAAVADIAPTLSAILGLPAPGGSRGRVLAEIWR